MENYTGRCFKDNNGKYILVVEDDGHKTMLKVVELEPSKHSISINEFFYYRKLNNDRPDNVKFTEIDRREFMEVHDNIRVEITENIMTAKKNKRKGE